MTPARLLLVAITAAAAVAVHSAPVDNQNKSSQTAADQGKTEKELRAAERLKRLAAIEQNGWTDYIAKTLDGIFSRTVAKAVGAESPTSARTFLACGTPANDSSPSEKAVVAEKPTEVNATTGGECGTSPSPLASVNSATFNDKVRKQLKPVNYTTAAQDNVTTCKPGDTREVCLIARNQAGGDESSSPVINVLLQKNKTDTDRVDRIHNVTSLDRNTTQKVASRLAPRSVRIREREKTDDSIRRDTNRSESDHRVGVRVSLGDHSDLVIGLAHGTKDTKIKEDRQTKQQTFNHTETQNKTGTRKATETQDRLRKSLNGANVRETITTLNVTIDNRNNGGAPGGSDENVGPSSVTNSAGDEVPTRDKSSRPAASAPKVTPPDPHQPTDPRPGGADDGADRKDNGIQKSTAPGPSGSAQSASPGVKPVTVPPTTPTPEPGGTRPWPISGLRGSKDGGPGSGHEPIQSETQLSVATKRTNIVVQLPLRSSPDSPRLHTRRLTTTISSRRPESRDKPELSPASPGTARDPWPGQPSSRRTRRRLSSPAPVQPSLTRASPAPATPQADPAGPASATPQHDPDTPGPRPGPRTATGPEGQRNEHWSGRTITARPRDDEFILDLDRLRKSLVHSAFVARSS